MDGLYILSFVQIRARVPMPCGAGGILTLALAIAIVDSTSFAKSGDRLWTLKIAASYLAPGLLRSCGIRAC